MIGLILFVIGAWLFYTGKFSFGSTQTQGRHVRAAGVVLMSPESGTLILGVLAGMFLAPDQDALMNIVMVLALFEIVTMVISVFVAYILIVDPQNAPHLPGILGKIQDERHQSGTQATFVQTGRSVQTPVAPAPKVFGSVLTVAEAAAYMKVADADILQLIDDGKLAAARISNNSYRIARSNLDELMSG